MTETVSIGLRDDGTVVKLNIKRLIASRMLITADSGGGKSYLLRKVIEGLSKSTQTIVIDPEGEFASLREIRDMVLVGPDGEVPAEPRSAALLCRRLMELHLSAVIDLSELDLRQRQEYVAAFCTTMVELPRSLWHRCFVVVDEAHESAPEGEKSVSEGPLASLSTKGRKRGYCLIPGTQRLSSFSKNVAAGLKNQFLGTFSLDADIKRAAGILGFGKDRWTEIRDLSSVKEREGEFFCLGPAMNHRGVAKMRAGEVESTHPEVGQGKPSKPPAPSKKILGVIGELKDLPREAEQEIKDLAAAKARIIQLEREAKTKPPADPAVIEKLKTQAVAAAERQFKTTIVKLRKGLEEAMKVVAEINARGFNAVGVDPKLIYEAVESAADRIVELAEQGLQKKQAEWERVRRDAKQLVAKMQKLLADEGVQVQVDVNRNEPFTVQPATSVSIPDVAPGVEDQRQREQLTGPERRIVDAYAFWHSIGVAKPAKQNIGPIAGYRNLTSKGFVNSLSSLRTAGLLQDDALTDTGRAAASWPEKPDTLEKYHEKLMSVMGGPEKKLFKAIHAAGGETTREVLADAAGFTNLTSKGFVNPLSRLNAMGIISKEKGKSDIKGSSLMYPPALIGGES